MGRYFDLYCCNSDGSINTNEECCKDRPASEKAGVWAQYQYEQGNQDYTFAEYNFSAGGPNQWKCNSFVRDALNKVGGVSWSDLPKSYSNGKKSKYAAHANNYANTSLNTDVLDTIDGSNLKLGDIVLSPVLLDLGISESLDVMVKYTMPERTELIDTIQHGGIPIFIIGGKREILYIGDQPIKKIC